MKRRSAHFLLPVAALGIVMSACGESASTLTTPPPVAPRVAITSVKGDDTSALLAAIFARVLESAGFRVARKDPVELDRAGYYAALQSNEFQLIPDFSGDLMRFLYEQPGAPTAPTTVVPLEPATTQAPVTIPTTTIAATTVPGTTVPGDTVPADTITTDTVTTDTVTTDTVTTDTVTTDTVTTDTVTTDTAPAETSTTQVPITAATTTTLPAPILNGRTTADQVKAIRAALAKTVAIDDGLLAESKRVIACTPAAVKANENVQLFTISNLASIAPKIRLGGSAEFLADTESGFPAVQQFYGGDWAPTVTVTTDGLADAIDKATADCFAVDSLDPIITNKKLTVLVDDKAMVPANAVIALVSSTVATPDLIAAIDTLIASLTTERLNQMLVQVASGTAPSVVADAFMATI